MFHRNGLNPVLETRRDALLAEGQDSRTSLLQGYKKTISNTKHIHSSFLFTTESGRLILKSICCMVSSVQPSIFNTSWLDFAAKLGYTDAQIKCAGNLYGPVYDPTQQIIEYFAATPDGTVGDIFQALIDLDLLPPVHQAQQHIDGFIAEVESKPADGRQNTMTTEDGYIVKPASYKSAVPVIFDSLPSKAKTLDNGHIRTENNGIVQTSFTPPRTKPKMIKRYSKIVLLSFAADGLHIAKKMADILRSTKNNKGFSIGVVILLENQEEVEKNPAKVIALILSQVSFVIPVLTEGYFKALQKPDPLAELLDERYIQYIYDILLNKFIQNQCFNLHVRPLISKLQVNDICCKKEFTINSILKPYRTDDEMESLALSILKSRKETKYA